MSAHPANTRARSRTCRNIHRKASCAVVTFQGRRCVPWKTAVNDDATFKAAAELEKIYVQGCGVNQKTDTIVYCRIGERSSHTWFVLTYLLGLNNVRNYDGSWTEWGNRVGAPIEKSE